MQTQEETKITLKIGIIATTVTSILIFIISCLWSYNSRLTSLEINYINLNEKLNKIDINVETIKDSQFIGIDTTINKYYNNKKKM
jgi:hypothetical protein